MTKQQQMLSCFCVAAGCSVKIQHVTGHIRMHCFPFPCFSAAFGSFRTSFHRVEKNLILSTFYLRLECCIHTPQPGINLPLLKSIISLEIIEQKAFSHACTSSVWIYSEREKKKLWKAVNGPDVLRERGSSSAFVCSIIFLFPAACQREPCSSLCFPMVIAEVSLF